MSPTAPFAAALVLLGGGTALAQHAVAPPDSYPRLAENQGRICEEDLDEHGCVVGRCHTVGQPRDRRAPGTVTGPSATAEHPELCKAGTTEPMPSHAESAQVPKAPPQAEPSREWGPRNTEPPRLIESPKLRYGSGSERDALFLARTRTETGAAQGWSLPLKFIAVGGGGRRRSRSMRGHRGRDRQRQRACGRARGRGRQPAGAQPASD